MARGERDQLLSPAVEKRIADDDDPFAPCCVRGREGRVEIALAAGG